MQIKVEYNQLLEMATAFGVRRLDAALAVILDSIDFRDKEPEEAFSTINATESKWTTKAASSDTAGKLLQRRRREIASLRLPAVSQAAALQRLSPFQVVDCIQLLFAQASTNYGGQIGRMCAGKCPV